MSIVSCLGLLTRSVDLFFKTAISSSPKITIPPKKKSELSAVIFFRRDCKLQTYHENFLSMDNKYRKLFVIKQSKGCKFMPKIHQNTFGSRALPGPVGGGLIQMHSRRPSSRNGGLFLRAGRDGEWVYI